MKKRLFAALTILCVLAPHLHAAVTNVRYFRLGEFDLQHVSGTTATSTEDATGGSPMTLNGPQYSADVFNTLSSVSMTFSGGQYGDATVVDNLSTNFGVELWVKLTSTPQAGTNRSIVYVGTPSVNGWGLIQTPVDDNLSSLSVTLGGVTNFGSVTIPMNLWVHLALVCGTTNSTLYVNGAQFATTEGIPLAPNANANLRVGGDTNGSFAGGLDELRIFKFDENAFTITDLRYIPRFRLDIVKTATGQTLIWPDYYHRYFVETSTNMDTSAPWSPVYDKRWTQGMIYVDRTDTNSQRFYRLSPCGELLKSEPYIPAGKYVFMTRNSGAVLQLSNPAFRYAFNNGNSTNPTTFSVENYIDPYDLNCTGKGELQYNWTVTPSGGNQDYTNAGITGTHSAALSIKSDSMLNAQYDITCDITSVNSGLVTRVLLLVSATGSHLTQ